MRIRPVAVTPIDWPKSPMPRSSQYDGMVRGTIHSSRNTLSTMPPTHSSTNGQMLSAMASSEMVASAATMSRSSARPWMRSMMPASMRWP